MSLSTIINYTNPANFTFNASLVNFNGTNAQLKNIRPPSSTFYNGFHVGFNGEYGDGVLTGTPNGSPSVSGNELILTGGGVRNVDYTAVLNANSAQTGTIRFQYTPQYSGTPGTYQVPIVITNVSGGLLNTIEIYHTSGAGVLGAYCSDQAGSLISGAPMVFGAFSPISGTSYEIEFDYDFTGGNSRMFVNGIQSGSTAVGTGTRNAAAIGLFRVGTDYSLTYVPNFNLTDVIIFDTVQHTADFPGEIPRLPETLYSTQNPSIIVNAPQPMSSFLAFTESVTIPSNTAVQYQIIVNGQAKYWSGAAWVNSNSSFAQSNTAATINTNLAALNISPGANIQISALLDSTLGNATPILTSVQEDYTFFVPSPTPPPQCIVYAFLQDIIGDLIVTNAFLVADLPKSLVINNYFIAPSKQSVAFNSLGYAALNLVSTDTLVPEAKYNFYIQYTQGTEQTIIGFTAGIVPTAISAALDSIVTIV